MPDTAYAVTRRSGQPAVVVRNTSTQADAETGERSMQTALTHVRLVVKEPTAYSRIIAAKEANRDVGRTTFIFWTNDIPFRVLNQEDYVVWNDGTKYQVVSTVVEATGLLVTAEEVVGAVPVVIAQLEAANAFGFGQEVEED